MDSGAPRPTQIGPYRILDVLGEGGMGTVFLAEQSTPKRRVALKLIKLGMDSKAVVLRFEQERQALAMMAHDGIAKVFDCGMSDRGQPFFVMELVKGVPLNQFCEQQKLSLPQRLLLMKQVCAAVQHAHQKGVVHRDLKPGNVLVSEDAGKLQVKIIDFGLAKAMGQKLVEATLFTEAGQIVGTPEYMSPEQADPSNADIDTRADIYSLGVMLYEVLVSSLPFSQAELRKAGMLEMQRVLREVEPQKPSTKLTSVAGSAAEIAAARRMSPGALQRALKNDLDWVVLKALEKDRARRYDTANALAADLQRFLDHEPLVAGPPSAGYRLKKLVRRYRGQVLAGAAVLVALVAGGIGTFVQYLRAEDKATEAIDQKGKAEANATLARTNETRANEKAAEALREKGRADAKATELDGKVREFDQLAGVVLYDRAIANEKDLYPAWPHKVEAMATWLRDDAGKLLAMQGGIEQTVHDLQARALPATAKEQEADRRLHPKFAEFEGLGKRVASLRYAQAIRDGKAQLVVPPLTAEQQALDGKALNTLAWDRVAPKAEERKVYGEEALGLACARLAVSKAVTSDEYQLLDTLAWALLANGQDTEAKEQSAAALAKAPEREKESYRGYQRDLDAAIDLAAEALIRSEADLAALSTTVNERRTFRFELESQRFLHDTLADLLTKLRSLAMKEKAEVDKRLAWGKQIESVTLAHPNAKHTWASVRTAIAVADDVVASRLYAGKSIELRDHDITGLVPIGMNPVTKLWEFYELRSAWDGKADPKTIVIPAHEPDGSIEVTGELGIVFVLLPGGTFLMGAQKDDPNGPNYDPGAEGDETPHEVTLAPFFLARHELTQGQWTRLSTGDPDQRQPSYYKAGQTIAGQKITGRNPVEQVDWTMCDTLLSRQGLVLPTEAQWEYGCRGGTTTPWVTELAKLKEFANVADASAKALTTWTCETWTDGHVVHAPVGSFAANAFGLYDVHGNVWEWCLNEHSSGVRSYRGGSFVFPAVFARSAFRPGSAPSFRNDVLGLRPARTSRL